MKHIKLFEQFISERERTQEERERLAAKGWAQEDGSYPIEDEHDLRNAIQAYGRSKDQAKTAKHIVKRAKRLGLEELVPQTKDFQQSLKSK